MDEVVIQILILAILLLWPTWRIFTRAGLQPIISLLVLIPGFGFLICAVILAFSKWQPQRLKR